MYLGDFFVFRRENRRRAAREVSAARNPPRADAAGIQRGNFAAQPGVIACRGSRIDLRKISQCREGNSSLEINPFFGSILGRCPRFVEASKLEAVVFLSRDHRAAALIKTES